MRLSVEDRNYVYSTVEAVEEEVEKDVPGPLRGTDKMLREEDHLASHPSPQGDQARDHSEHRRHGRADVAAEVVPAGKLRVRSARQTVGLRFVHEEEEGVQAAVDLVVA